MLDEEILLTKVLLHQLNVSLITAGDAQVLHSTVVNGEVAHSCTVFGGHVSDSGSVSQAELLDTWSEELDELSNNTALSEHLDTGQDQVSGSSSLWELTVEMEADNLRQNHGNGLAEHDSFGFNATDTPASDTETVDHGSVRVCADDGVWVQHVVAVEDDTGEVLQVHLMDNTGAGWDNLEIVEGLGAPLEELEALAVTLELELFVLLGGAGDTSGIDLDGVIDDEIDGAERVDLARVASKTVHSVTHGSKINDGGNTAILQIKS